LILIVSPDFTDAITGDWGGRPFDDLIEGWKNVLAFYPEVNAISPSASFV
jgi:dipeptidyl aminopeptidase/acylaminoacyl peptidase